MKDMLKLKSWNQISDDMNYNVRYLFHIHGAALNEFYQMYEQEINADVLTNIEGWCSADPLFYVL